MKLPHHTRPTAAALAALALLLAVTGCSAEPEPEPTPTTLVFETDEEAYAAAEAVYRAYLIETNKVDYADPGAYSLVEPYLTGSYAKSERKSMSAAYADGITKKGDFVPLWVRGVERTDNGDVVLIVCDDLSTVARFNADGTSRVHPDRPDAAARRITFSIVGPQLRITSAELETDPECTL